MKTMMQMVIFPLLVLVLLAGADPLDAAVEVQCPGDTDGDAQWTGAEVQPPNTKCLHLAAGDGFIRMADGTSLYSFGFNNVTGILPNNAISAGLLAAEFSAPTMWVDEGEHFYLSLTTVGMVIRPDLFDPHTVHFHGFPNAASVFDGEPMASIAINTGSTFTYYYNIVEPGTYLYHCHVEATEHMQMGMLGNLFVRPAQNGQTFGGFTKFAYNDGDGSTGYDREFVLQIGSFDAIFHTANETVQPLPFAAMEDTYPMLNGRGYPKTLLPPCEAKQPGGGPGCDPSTLNVNGLATTPVSSIIQANQGESVLLRVSSVSTVDFHTLTVLGIPMRVVGKDARLLRNGLNDLSYLTSTITLGGGESLDVILDTTGIPQGTYFLYVSNLNHLNNDHEDYGGAMTEVRVAAPGTFPAQAQPHQIF